MIRTKRFFTERSNARPKMMTGFAVIIPELPMYPAIYKILKQREIVD